MNNAKKSLLGGTFVYFIGNVMVSLIQLVLLRFITANIDRDGYGYYNTIVLIDNLVTPVLTLQISDAVFRNIIRGDFEERKKTVTNGTIVIISGIIITVCVVYSINNAIFSIPHCALVILYIISTNIFAFYQKMARAVGANVDYVKTNLLKAVLYLIIQVVLILVFEMKEESLFISLVLSTFICLLYLESRIKARQYFSIKMIDKMHLSEMLKFSIPLMPNTMLWWLSGSVNSLIINARLGLDYNGVFSVAGKFSALITMAASVFNLAWQESAIKEYDSESSKAYFRDIYMMFYRAICSAVFVCIPVMYIVMPYIIDKSYYDAIRYAPLLVIGAGIAAAYGFFGQMYSATGKTKGAAVSTLFGVVANLSVIFLLIDWMGLWAPSLALLVSGSVILIIRYIQFKKTMNLSVTLELIGLIAFIGLTVGAYYSKINWLNYLLFALAVGLAFFVNRALLKDVAKIIIKRVRRKH